MRNPPFLKLLSLSVLALLLTACTGFPPREDALRVNLSSMKMLESTLLEQRFEVTIRVQNRSQSSLGVEGVTFDLELNGKDFASGVNSQEVTIEPFSEALLSINLTSTLFAVIRQIRSLESLQTEPFRYHLSGTLYTGSFIGVPFSEQGVIDFSAQPGTL